MIVRDLLALLQSHALDGRGLDEQVLVEIDGRLRLVADIEVKLLTNGHERPMPTFVVIVADGLAS